MTNTRKTPAEIAEAARIAFEKAQARAMKAEAKDNPAIAGVHLHLATVNKEIASYSRQTTGPNSFANRIRSAELRLARANAEQAYVLLRDTYARKVKDYLQKSIDSIVEALASDPNYIAPDANDVWNGRPGMSSDLLNAEQAFKDADRAWRDSTPANLRKSFEPDEAQADSAGA